MQYRVKRLLTEDHDLVGYQLFSESGSLLLVADLIAAAGSDAERQVRFGRPDGTLLATMGVAAEEEKSPPAPTRDYVIIQDYAVYAIVTRHTPAATEATPPPSLFYTMEAEASNWLIIPSEDKGAHFHIYGQTSLPARSLDSLAERELPPQVGHIFPLTAEEHDLQVDLTSRRWRQTTLVILALIFLLDAPPPDTTSVDATAADTISPDATPPDTASPA